MYFTGLQNVSHFKYYPKNNFRKKSFCETFTFKKSYGQATLKQNWINKISYLLNYMTDFLSQSPSSKKPYVETKLEISKYSSLMQLRERERPKISLANNSIHGHLYVTALLQVQYTLCREGQMSLRLGVVPSNLLKVQEIIYSHLSLPLACGCSLTATPPTTSPILG